MAVFDIHPDIAQAKTISTDFYLDPHFFKESKEKIFSKSWHFVGDADLVKDNGWVTPVSLFQEFLNEPLLLSRDKNGDLHCLSNVCTHRGNLIVDKPCKVNDLRCRYHGRRFELNGKFSSMPEFKEVKNFPTTADDLVNLPVHQWGKLLFASLDKKFKADLFFKQMADRVAWMPLNEFVFHPELSKDYLIDAHWALYCENYLEGFHIPFVHAGLNSVIDYGNYSVELFPYSSLQLGIGKPGGFNFDLPANSPDYGKDVAGYYFWVFPNMMFNFYPWGLSVNIIQPISNKKTKVSFLTFVWDESKLRQGAGADLHKVELEDEEIVQSVQKGIRSRFYNHGRYSVTREMGTHHFHRLIAEFMK
ncbi:MAG: aromatic ring-hydroxylating dioxygenase subunit alpha [Cytophagales bacterium]|jgi:choline monooxygenase|nr:aromatic ring-hydroxylating dioxygenase subunit alpha [Cytophagales bacterium]MCA6378759.1 aromatic ring-hydroxylating dioxygenase subunit alpha [Cytophagales bacterium]MCA6387802.1 aromatic ring-hydroxylating dioxygenase subunit alpha [Cytophagales bacterium]MCA6390537.1 aromatic ring-hydroxylating dioxygenase subunit alpha [Cytophagales bacterium]MCA6396146.1 aromatic ring-hydroxylating dioxygenase subunit alpha [Cytophagales bacterium]